MKPVSDFDLKTAEQLYDEIKELIRLFFDEKRMETVDAMIPIAVLFNLIKSFCKISKIEFEQVLQWALKMELSNEN